MWFNRELFSILVIQSGKNLKQIAAAIKINYKTILRWRAGKHQPEIGHLKKLADFFGVSIKKLMKSSNTFAFNERLNKYYLRKYVKNGKW